ncbi:PDGLE domain-containing protein [Actinokineospora auranticolor]|uniref:Cobalt/nickel transport protein n=1 Tax=Actinokineospora auranticolor TaxID=155976 RepID=A0A2S6GC00_9PSEU|nr:PDGLE domain-containing protein [Actinokineospora auranticolor]PPK61578.1 cobalt/nickel transport protein [Actinokineospora auranticolor]
MSTKTRRNTGFLLGFLLVALVLAGAVSYFADSNPDGLDHATLAGCQVVEDGHGGETLQGTCIAQNAKDHHLAGSPLADYVVNGGEGTTGLAGVIGVAVTVVVAGGLFWLLRRRPTK